MHEPTVVEKIGLIIVEVVSVVAELTRSYEGTLMRRQLIEDNKRPAVLQTYAQTA